MCTDIHVHVSEMGIKVCLSVSICWEKESLGIFLIEVIDTKLGLLNPY